MYLNALEMEGIVRMETANTRMLGWIIHKQNTVTTMLFLFSIPGSPLTKIEECKKISG
jgi:hypothetical protein